MEISFCAECEDHPAMIFCETCGGSLLRSQSTITFSSDIFLLDAYCNECYISFHKKGQRKYHHTHLLHQQLPTSLVAPMISPNEKLLTGIEPSPTTSVSSSSDSTSQSEQEQLPRVQLQPDLSPSLQKQHTDYASSLGVAHLASWRSRCAYIPLRLTRSEHKELSLMECALFISEYTDHVDIDSYSPAQRKIAVYLSELLSIISGLAVSSDYRAGDSLVRDKKFGNSAPFFQHMFEGLQHCLLCRVIRFFIF